MSKSRDLYEKELPGILARIGQKVGFEVALFRFYKNPQDPKDGGKWFQVEVPNPNGYQMSNGDPYYRYHVGGFYQFAVVKADTPTPTTALSNLVLGFNISHFPGSCAMAVSHTAYVASPFGHRGINQLGLELRIAIAGASKYTSLLCSDIVQNEWSIKGIERAGFQVIHKVKNRRTGNDINVYVKEL